MTTKWVPDGTRVTPLWGPEWSIIVLTFENFKFFESDEFKVSNLKQCLYKGIEKADLNMEKVVADVFDTNLGSIDVVDSGKHIFKVNDWNGKDINVLIYSKEDLELIKSNLVDCLYDELTSKKVLLGGLIDVSLVDFVSQDGFTTMMNDQLSGDGLNDIITVNAAPTTIINFFVYLQTKNGDFVIDNNTFVYNNNNTQKNNDTNDQLFYFDYNKDGLKDIGYVDGNNGAEYGPWNPTTKRGNHMYLKTVFIRTGNQFIEKSLYDYDPYAKSLLPILNSRFK